MGNNKSPFYKKTAKLNINHFTGNIFPTNCNSSQEHQGQILKCQQGLTQVAEKIQCIYESHVLHGRGERR